VAAATSRRSVVPHEVVRSLVGLVLVNVDGFACRSLGQFSSGLRGPPTSPLAGSNTDARHVDACGRIQFQQNRPEDECGGESADENGDLLVLWSGAHEEARFQICDVVPPFDDAMQTMAPIESAVT